MLEIRGHARGGQGMVTAFEILAKIFIKSGNYQVQSFPAFGVERTGAPVQAFLRVSKNPIFNRSNIYNPHFIVVFDESLINQVPVFRGLIPNGCILLNTNKNFQDFTNDKENIFTIPATNISLELGLGTKSLPIVNSAMIGAIAKLLNLDIELTQKIIKENVPAKPEQNALASFQAYQQFEENTGLTDFLLRKLIFDGNGKVQKQEKEIEKKEVLKFPRVPYWEKPMSANKTGNWRVITPKYIEKDPPCSANCPAGTDVRKFVKLTSQQKFNEAFDTIYEHNPFPSICGRVCPHFCEQNCNRLEFDEGLNIGSIERFLGDLASDNSINPPKIRHSEKIAIIGSGPAGLTAALRLRLWGYDTTVFEAQPLAGGMMRTGIPKFRLPDSVLDTEINRILNYGVNLILNKKVCIQDLENDFDCAIVSVGSHIGTKLNIENENLTIDGIDFLREFKLNNNSFDININDEVAIIGGGNTAIDVARTLLRLGARPTIYYRRTIKEMPAIAHEVEEALSEGVNIRFLTAPVSVSKLNDKLLELKLIKMQLGKPDSSGRRKPLPVENSETVIRVNKIIKAIGQKFDSFVFNNKPVNPKQGKVNFESKIPVFCAGDMAWGGTVTEAIGSGNKVAAEVNAFLRNESYSDSSVYNHIVLPSDINFNYFLPVPRHKNNFSASANLLNDFSEVVNGLSENEIIEESKRCLHCGDCFSCGNCYNFCPDAAIFIDEAGRLRIDYDYCKGCGICAHECPCSAIIFNLDEVNYE